MNPGASETPSLAEFAKAHGLGLTERVELPRQGSLLSKGDLVQSGAATGALPGGGEGTLCHLTYTYRSDDTARLAGQLRGAVAKPPG